MIVRDNEATIARTLDSIVGVVDVLVVVDTGGTDATMEIVRSYRHAFKAIITGEYECPEGWTQLFIDHFANARNTALDLVPKDCEWVLTIDSDEVLVGGKRLRKTLMSCEVDGPRLLLMRCVSCNNGVASHTHFSPRVFTRKDFTWKGRVHNYIVANRDYLQGALDGVEINAEYTASHKDGERGARRMYMLRYAMEHDEWSPRICWYLARELLSLYKIREAWAYYAMFLQRGGGNEFEVNDAWESIAMCAMAENEVKLAEEFVGNSRDDESSLKYLVMGQIELAKHSYDNARKNFLIAMQCAPSQFLNVEAYRTWMAWEWMAVLELEICNNDEALKWHAKAMSVAADDDWVHMNEVNLFGGLKDGERVC